MKVYFNNSCKICRAEINLYKKEKIKEIDWVDITNNQAAEKETSASPPSGTPNSPPTIILSVNA